MANLTFDVLARAHETGFDQTHQKMKLVAAAAGVLAVKFGVDSVKAYADAEKSQQQLQFAYQKFPKLADVSLASLQKLNSAQERKTKFDDDATASAEAVLAQYKLTGTQLKTLVPLLQDYAAKTGKDLPGAAGDLGKALLGQGRALKTVGINFKDTGTQAGNFKELVGGLRTQVGGFAEKEGKTAAGQAAILKNEFGEFQEAVGKAALAVGQKLLPPLIKSADFIQRNSSTIVPLVGGLGGLAAVVYTVNKATQAWTATQKAANTILAITKIRAIEAAIAESAVGDAAAANAAGSAGAIGGAAALASKLKFLGVALGVAAAGYVAVNESSKGLQTKSLGAMQSSFDEVAQGAAKAGLTARDLALAISGSGAEYDKFKGQLEKTGSTTKAQRQELDNLRSTLGGMSKNEQQAFLKQLGLTAPAIDKNTAATQRNAAATQHSAAATQAAAAQQALHKARMAASTAGANILAHAMAHLTNKTLGIASANTSFHEQLLAVTEAEKTNGRSISLNTQKGLANRQAIESAANALLGKVDADQKAGRSAQATAVDFGHSRTALLHTIATTYGAKSAAYQYAAQLTKIPKNIRSQITAATAVANDRIARLQSQIDALHGKVVSVDVYGTVHQAGQRATGGHLARARGGPIAGAGTGTSDSILARLSNGEYVINAKSAAMFRPMLDRMNAYGLARGGPVDVRFLFPFKGRGNPSAYSNVGLSAFGLAPGFGSAGGPSGGSPSALQRYAASLFPRFGWGQGQLGALISLWNGESGWNPRALNKSSGAFGIPQSLPASKMASAGADWRTNAATQIRWGENYIHDVYGSPSAAYGAWLSRSPHWYRRGGLIGRASGGRVARGKRYLVNEQGQELFVGDGSAFVIPGGPHMWQAPASGTIVTAAVLQRIRSKIGRAMTGSIAKLPGAAGSVVSALDQLLPGRGAVERGIDRQNAALERAAGRRAVIADRLQAANQRLADAQKTLRDKAREISQGLLGTFNLGQFGATAEGGPVTLGGILADARRQAASLVRFRAGIQRLQRLGLNKQLVDQLAAAGPSEQATVLFGAERSQVQVLNAQFRRAAAAANRTGALDANSLYGAGVRAAQGLVRGLRSQEAALDRQMRRMGEVLVRSIRRALGIRSPAAALVPVGRFTALGFAKGIDDNTHHVKFAAARMAGAAMPVTVGGGYGGGGGHLTVVLPGLYGGQEAIRAVVAGLEQYAGAGNTINVKRAIR